MRAHVIENGKVVNTILVDRLDIMPNLIDAAQGGEIGDLWDGKTFTKAPPSPEELERAAQEVKANLREIDIASIRSIREFVAAKFANDPLLPKDDDGKPILVTYETQAAAERVKLTVIKES